MFTPKPGASKPPPKLPVQVESLNLTLRTMESRMRMYRVLGLSVGGALLGSLILAVIFRKWILLTGWLAAPLFFGCFLYLDGRKVRAWRDRVLAMRNEEGLDVVQLERTLTALRYFPEGTRRSLFATLTSENPKA